MTDDDVVLLLERAAGLAPDRLDREPVAAVARRRRRRALSGSAAGLVAVVAAALLVVVPGGGQAVLSPAAEGDGATEFFQLTFQSNVPNSSSRPGETFETCVALPGAAMVIGPASLAPTAVVSAVGPGAARAAVEDCLRRLTNASVRPASEPELRAVAVAAAGRDLGPLRAVAGRSYPSMFAGRGRHHDLTLVNDSSDVVDVADLATEVRLPTGLRVVVGRELEPSALALQPGAELNLQVTLSAGEDRQAVLPTGEFALDVPVRWRSVGSDGVGVVQLRYGITGPSAPDVSRAAVVSRPPGDDSTHFAGTAGVLAGDPATGCLWVAGPGGGPPTPVLLRLYEPARVDFASSPFRVLEQDRVVASEGDVISLVGGFGTDGSGIPSCPVAGVPFTGLLPPD